MKDSTSETLENQLDDLIDSLEQRNNALKKLSNFFSNDKRETIKSNTNN